MLNIIFDVEHDTKLAAQRVHERVDWSIADTSQRAWLTLNQHLRTDRRRTFRVAAHLVAFEFELRFGQQIFALKSRPHHIGRNFGARIFGDVLNRLREFNLQTTRQRKTMLGLHHIRNAALARLTVDANHSLVSATDMFRVDRQIWHGPFVVIFRQRIETFFDCILMTARKRGVNQITRIRLSLGHRQTVAIFGIASQRIDVVDV